jgi:hypothetical protein
MSPTRKLGRIFGDCARQSRTVYPQGCGERACKIGAGYCRQSAVGARRDAAERDRDLPYLQSGGGDVRAAWLAIRTRSEPSTLIAASRNEIRSLDPSLPVSKVRGMDDVIASVESRPRR